MFWAIGEIHKSNNRDSKSFRPIVIMKVIVKVIDSGWYHASSGSPVFPSQSSLPVPWLNISIL
jgi:hypothetical protein